MEKYITIYLSVTWFCVLFNTLLLITVAFIHELGHFMFAYLEGCSATIVAFDLKYGTYTEIQCAAPVSVLVNLGGLIFTLLFSCSFLFLDLPEKKFFITSLGLSLLLASYDIPISEILSPPLILVGSSLIVLGQVKFLREKLIAMERHEVF